MHIHYLQHESFEDLASIFQWADRPENTITSTRFYESNYIMPSKESIDLLVIMGGPMSVYDEKEFPWLIEEKKFIKEVIEAGKKVLGICLGSQLLAEVLGAKVYKNTYKEIGWMEVELTDEAKEDKYFKDLPKNLKVFQWHGDTFNLPDGAKLIASSEACKNQAFTYQDRVVALQFHMEATKKTVEELVCFCKEELVDGKYIQKQNEILADSKYLDQMNKQLFGILDKLRSN